MLKIRRQPTTPKFVKHSARVEREVKLKKTFFLLASIFLMMLGSFILPQGNSILYVSAAQKIISTSPGWPTLFILNVTFPYEAKVGEEFSIYIQLWQGKNTSVYVNAIRLWLPGDLTQTLIRNQTLQNLQQNEILVVNKTVAANVQKRQRWQMSVSYSVKDLSVDGGSLWMTGSNHLASVHVYPQTYDELANHVSNLQDQISDLHKQQLGLVFIIVYVTVTLGIAVPIVQKRRKTILSSRYSTKN